MSTIKFPARAFAALMAVSVLLAAAGPAAAATRPQRVTIVSDMVVSSTTGNPLNHGTFTTSGSSLICAAGIVDDTSLTYLRGPNQNGYVLTVDKTFTCSDGSGALYFTLLVRGNSGGEKFVWALTGGTGDYARRLGLGTGTSVAIADRGDEHVHRLHPLGRRPANCGAGTARSGRSTPSAFAPDCERGMPPPYIRRGHFFVSAAVPSTGAGARAQTRFS